MIDFLHHAKDMELVIVDESFIDFAGEAIPSLLQVADQFSNLLLVRSMSKHCGVPGLRLGYCYSGNLYRAESHAPVRSHLEREHAGAIFSVAAARPPTPPITKRASA